MMWSKCLGLLQAQSKESVGDTVSLSRPSDMPFVILDLRLYRIGLPTPPPPSDRYTSLLIHSAESTQINRLLCFSSVAGKKIITDNLPGTNHINITVLCVLLDQY